MRQLSNLFKEEVEDTIRNIQMQLMLLLLLLLLWLLFQAVTAASRYEGNVRTKIDVVIWLV